MSEMSSSTPALPEPTADEAEQPAAPAPEPVAEVAPAAPAAAPKVRFYNDPAFRAQARSAAVLSGTALLPALLVLAYDCYSRSEMFTARAGPPVGGYVGGAALSLALWGLVVESSRHPRRAVRFSALFVLGLTAAFGIGGQLLFHATAHEYFNRDAVVFSIHMWPIILDYLFQNPVLNLSVLFGFGIAAVAYAALRHRRLGPRKHYPSVGAGLAAVAIGLTALLPLRIPSTKHGLPPEVLFWQAAGGVGLYAVGLIDKPRTLPPGQHLVLPPSRVPVTESAPDVILIFGESVRRDEVCAHKSPSCSKSPRLDAAAPNRIGFSGSFAVASCTEVSSAILWTGLPIWSSSDAMQKAPLLWDYAKARGYRTGYLSSQSLAFQDQGTFLRTSQIDEKREARDRVAHADVDLGSDDMTSAEETLAFLAKGGPTFAVLHLSNTHLPYRQVEGYTPHTTSVDHVDARTFAETLTSTRHARYLNSLAFQDGVIGDFVEKVRKTERGKRAIILYTADHGEAWGEHDSYTHTFDLYGEQINVPFWIDAPEGTLSEAQLAELRTAAESRPVYTADVAATLLDLLGALDEPQMAGSTSHLAGSSVLRPPPGPREMELSNCPPFRGCFPESWGMVRWPLKYHYVGRAFESVCFDLESDSTEKAPLPIQTCQGMRDTLVKRYGLKPEKSPEKSGSGSSSP